MILGYLVAQGLVVQLGRFCHFLPGRSRRSAEVQVELGALPDTYVWKDGVYNPLTHLKESDFLLLASRSQDRGTDTEELRFFVLFVLEIVRPHRRIDSVDFQELLQRLNGETQPGEISSWPAARGLELLAANTDIFVQYSSRC
eukprot:g30784.t1